MEIGQQIAKIREDAGLSQSALARAIGTSQSAISQIEAGDRNPSYDMLRQIAQALNVSVPYLVGAEVETLEPEEHLHFRQYRKLSDGAKQELADYLKFLRFKQDKNQAVDPNTPLNEPPS